MKRVALLHWCLNCSKHHGFYLLTSGRDCSCCLFRKQAVYRERQVKKLIASTSRALADLLPKSSPIKHLAHRPWVVSVGILCAFLYVN